MATQPNSTDSSNKPSGCLPAFIRLLWFFFGNVALLAATFFIGKNEAGVIADIIFWLIVPALIAIRYIDITKFHGLTGENEPATLKDWKSYSIKLVGIAAVMYTVGKLMAMFHFV